MSSDAELYINETCRDTFTDELDKVFGKDNWTLDVSKYIDFFNMDFFPLNAKVNILDEDDKIIGVAIIVSKPEVIEEIGGRYIELLPIDIKITKVI